MAQKILPIQVSFQVGVISRRMLARLDSEIFSRGVAELKNMLPLFQGPAHKRLGSRHVTAFNGTAECRLMEFEVSEVESYAIAITGAGDNKLYVLGQLGQIPSDNYLGSDGNFENGQGSWVDGSTQQGAASFGVGFCTLSRGNNGFGRIDYTISGLTPSDTVYVGVQFDDDPFDIPVEITVSDTTAYLGDLLDQTTTQKQYQGSFTAPASGTAIIGLSISASQSVKTVQLVVSYSLAAGSIEFTTPAAWSGVTLQQLQSEMPPGDHVMYFASAETPPYKLSYNNVTDVWAFTQVTFTADPWGADNYPRAVTFFQGRSWWGGTKTKRETFWGSKTFSYEDMTQGVDAADALEYEIDKKGTIQWLAGVRNLLAGTANGEFIITSSDGVIVPGDVQIDQQSAYGSRAVEPQRIGNHVVYVSPDGRKVRSMGYQWTDDGWVTRDLTFFAEDITFRNGVTGITYLQNPESLIVCTTEQGAFLACSYDRENNIYAWSDHSYEGSGIKVLSVAKINNRGDHALALAVTNGIDTWIESFSAEYYIDSFTIQESSSADITTVDSPHLANETVRVLADGENRGTVTLDGSGQAALPGDPASLVVSGLDYEAKLVTLPLSVNTRVAGISSTKRFSRIGLRMESENMPTINGQNPEDRFADEQIYVPDSDLKIRDAFVQDLGFSQYEQVTIISSEPEFLMVHGIFGEATQAFND